MNNVAASPPEQGQLVHVRQRQWIVSDVAKSALPAARCNPSTLAKGARSALPCGGWVHLEKPANAL